MHSNGVLEKGARATSRALTPGVGAAQHTRKPTRSGRGRLRQGAPLGGVALSSSLILLLGSQNPQPLTFLLCFHQLLGYQRTQRSLVGYTDANFDFYHSKFCAGPSHPPVRLHTWAEGTPAVWR